MKANSTVDPLVLNIDVKDLAPRLCFEMSSNITLAVERILVIGSQLSGISIMERERRKFEFICQYVCTLKFHEYLLPLYMAKRLRDIS